MKKIINRIWYHKVFYIMMIPGLLWFSIFRYAPMYGIIIAFKDYNIKSGILKSPWATPLFKHFEYFFKSRYFTQLLSNTLIISVAKLATGMCASILLALILNECASTIFKKLIQTLTYMPHFLSWVIVYGIVLMFLSESDGFVNQMLISLGMKPIPFLSSPKYFRYVLVFSDMWKECGWGAIIYIAEVAEKFTYNDPDKNGIQDTIGLSGTSGWGAFAAVFGGYAIGTPGTIYVKDGELVSSLYEPDMKEVLSIIKNIIDKGVVDPELFTVSNAEIQREKCFQGKIGITYDQWPPFAKAEDAIKQVNPEANWVQIACPKGPKGEYDTPHAYFSSGLLSLSADLPKDEPKLNKIFELFNYISTREGNNLVSYGIEGYHYNVENGKIVATDKLASEGGYFWAYQLTGRPELEYLYTKFVGWEKEISFAAELPRLRNLEPFVVVPDNINLADANRFISEELIKFVYGRRSLDEYDAFLKELEEDFNYKEYLDICYEQLKSLGFIE